MNKFCFLILISIIISSCENEQKEFKFLEPDESFTQSMLDNGKMEKVILGCVDQYVYRQNDRVVIVHEGTAPRGMQISESWFIKLNSNQKEEIEL